MMMDPRLITDIIGLVLFAGAVAIQRFASKGKA